MCLQSSPRQTLEVRWARVGDFQERYVRRPAFFSGREATSQHYGMQVQDVIRAVPRPEMLMSLILDSVWCWSDSEERLEELRTLSICLCPSVWLSVCLSACVSLLVSINLRPHPPHLPPASRILKATKNNLASYHLSVSKVSARRRRFFGDAPRR